MYEYKIVVFEYFSDEIINELNKLGKEGWELVNSIEDGVYVKCYLKKKV